MNKVALYIPRPGTNYHIMQNGYIDALFAMGWKVYCCDPKTKLGCKQLIESYGVSLIFTHSRYGIRQLPIDVINDRGIAVIVNVLPFESIDGAHTDEAMILDHIKLAILHTHLQPDVWSTYLNNWMGLSVPLIHLPMAGNMIRALPNNCASLTDVAIVANLKHRPIVTKKLIIPLFQQLDILGYSYQIFGDELWQQTGLDYNGPLPIDKLAQVYATAKVCLNIHTREQVEMRTSVNERLFTISLCGGYQIVNSPLAAEYLGEHVTIASKTTTFITHTLRAITDTDYRLAQIRGAVEYVSHHHTYFNRLASIFRSLLWIECLEKAEMIGHDNAVRHCWEINARLSAAERGVQYSEGVI